jgi:hypothetical protein
MQTSSWHPDEPLSDRDESAAPQPESREARADRLGVRLSLLVLCVALALMALWFVSRPSFEKCSMLASQSERNVCYDKLRDELMTPPAKGANAPSP